jgi:hypothetical protein
MTVVAQDPTVNPADLVDLDQQRKLAEGVLNQLGLHPNQAGARNLLDTHFQGPTASPEVSNVIAPAPLINSTDQPTAPKVAPQAAIAHTSVTPDATKPVQPTATQVTPPVAGQEASQPLVSIGGPTIPSPSAASRIPSNLESRTTQDQDELNRLIRTGAGVSQVKNPFLKGLAAVGDIAGASLFPSIERLIPGTYGHHNDLINTQESRIKGDLANTETQARTEQARQATETSANEAKNKPNELSVWMQQNPGKPISEYWKAKADAAFNKMTPQQFAMKYYTTPLDEGGGGLTAGEALVQVNKDMAFAKPPNSAQQEQHFQELLAKVVGSTPDPKIISDPKTLFDMISKSENLTDPEKQEVFAHLTSKTSPAAQGGLATIRTQGLLQRGLTPVIDRDTGMLTVINAQEHIQSPNKYIGAAQGTTSMSREASFNELARVSSMARQAVTDLKTPFTVEQRAKLSLALRSPDPHSAMDSFLHSSVGQSLADDQVDWVTAIASLEENAMALRSVQGMGQGSDQLRGAIHAMIPGSGTPNLKTAIRQLNIFDALVNTLKVGVAKSGVNQPKAAEVPKTQDQTTTTNTPPTAGKTFTKTQVTAIAKQNGITYEAAKADAEKHGHKVDESR